MTNNSPELAIDVKALEFAYSGKADELLLNIVDWRVANGQQVFLFGPSGSGKTTLLNLLSGLLLPRRGSLRVLGQELSELSASGRDRFRANHIGFIHQQFNLIPYLNTLENLKLATHFSAKSHSAAGFQALVENMFGRLQLPLDSIKRKASELSVGQQQRIAIARALINSPEIIIADEPTSALDSDAKAGFINLLREIIADNANTLVFVSHDHSLSHQFDECIDLRELNSQRRLLVC